MEEKVRYNTGQLLNFTTDSYLERTSRPFYAIVFLLPFIVFYELGTIFINTDLLNRSQVRVVAFVWLQSFLGYLGFSDKFTWATPALAVVIILLALQLASRKKWYFTIRDFFPMSVECILLSIPLVVFSLFLNGPVQQRNGEDDFNSRETVCIQQRPAVCYSEAEVYRHYESQGQSDESAESYKQSQSAESYESDKSFEYGGASTDVNTTGRQTVRQNLLADIVTGIGAGIYEELVFRLILICLLIIIFQKVLQFEHKNAIVFSVLASAALFSAYHHIDFFSGQPTEPFSITVFGFRVIAGIYFAVVFATRGFAITAGTHAFYDIIVVFINAHFLQG